MELQEQLNKLQLTVDDLMQKLNEAQQANQKVTDIEKTVTECVNFDKRLIKALSACENANNITLLPSGTYHGEKID